MDVLILAVPETAGSALYGMVDVLMSSGNIWQTLVGSDKVERLFRVRIVSLDKKPFNCGNNIPVVPEYAISNAPNTSILRNIIDTHFFSKKTRSKSPRIKSIQQALTDLSDRRF